MIRPYLPNRIRFGLSHNRKSRILCTPIPTSIPMSIREIVVIHTRISKGPLPISLFRRSPQFLQGHTLTCIFHKSCAASWLELTSRAAHGVPQFYSTSYTVRQPYYQRSKQWARRRGACEKKKATSTCTAYGVAHSRIHTYGRKN